MKPSARARRPDQTVVAAIGSGGSRRRHRRLGAAPATIANRYSAQSRRAERIA
jgi:hypothetical protein